MALWFDLRSGNTSRYFPELPPKLKQNITTAALRSYELFQCRDYARVDLRVDQRGTPYVLEVNCNPDISPGAGFYRAFSLNGGNYADLVSLLISFAETESFT